MNRKLATIGLTLSTACILATWACGNELSSPGLKKNSVSDRLANNAQDELAQQASANTTVTMLGKDDLSCIPGAENQCLIIPDGCLGCMQKDGKNLAVNMSAGDRIMNASQKECEPVVKEFIKNNKQELDKLAASVQNGDHKVKPDFVSHHDSCKYTKAICNAQGKCEFGMMSQEEEQQTMQDMKQSMTNKN